MVVFAIFVVILERCILDLFTRSVWALSWQVPDVLRVYTLLLTVLPPLGAVGLRPKCEEVSAIHAFVARLAYVRVVEVCKLVVG
jgi:hypothetical protein